MLYKGKYHLKRLEEKDLPAVKEIFLKVFNKKVSLAYLKSKYDTSNIGIEYICSIAHHDKKPIAFYGAIPQKFSNSKNEVFIAHACDSFTLKAYQGQGLHYQLAKLSYQFMEEKGIKYVYAFHSENTYYSTKKLAWKEHVHLERFNLEVKTLPIAKVFNKLGMNAIYNLFFRKDIPNGSFAKLRLEHSDKFRQNLTSDFINYKNSFNDHYLIESEGCVLWVKIAAIMMVGLFYAPSENSFQKAIQKLKRKAFFLGINEILFQVDPASKMASQLRSIASPKKSWLLGYLDFDPEIDIQDFMFSYSDLDTF